MAGGIENQMSKQTEFLKKEKILHLATIDEKNSPHIVPVWYMYSAGKIYVGTNTKTQKAKNMNKRVAVEWERCRTEVGGHRLPVPAVADRARADMGSDARSRSATVLKEAQHVANTE